MCKKCNKQTCGGCGDSPVTLDTFCNAVQCDEQQCDETYNAKCTLYLGPDIVCDDVVIIQTGDSLELAQQKLVAFICSKAAEAETAIENVVTSLATLPYVSGVDIAGETLVFTFGDGSQATIPFNTINGYSLFGTSNITISVPDLYEGYNTAFVNTTNYSLSPQLNQPFAAYPDIASATAALSAAGLSSSNRGLIVVRSGTYAASNLNTQYITLFLDPEVYITGEQKIQNSDINIYGFGTLSYLSFEASTAGIVFNNFVELQDIGTPIFGNGFVYGKNTNSPTGNINVNLRNGLYQRVANGSSGIGINVRGDYNFNLKCKNNIYLRGTGMDFRSRLATSKIYIEANDIIHSGVSDFGYQYYQILGLTQGSCGKVHIKANIIDIANGNDVYHAFFSAFAAVNLSSTDQVLIEAKLINCGNQRLVVHSLGSGGKIQFKGCRFTQNGSDPYHLIHGTGSGSRYFTDCVFYKLENAGKSLIYNDDLYSNFVWNCKFIIVNDTALAGAAAIDMVSSTQLLSLANSAFYLNSSVAVYSVTGSATTVLDMHNVISNLPTDPLLTNSAGVAADGTITGFAMELSPDLTM